MAKSRTQKTAINTTVALVCTVISSLLSFVLQAVFIRLLGLEYSGVNALFSDIIKILNLADLGINNAILFKLYKTIATNNDAETEKFLTAYRKVCWITGAIVGIAGLCCLPFLSFFVKSKPAFSEPLWSLYLIVLTTCVTNHFINYKSILFIAKQDRYISTVIQYIMIFTKHGLQIVVLLLFKNIYLYLLVDLFTALLQGIIMGYFSTKKYHLSWHSKQKLTKNEKKGLTGDVGALAVFKLCRTLNATVDTFLISKFIAVASTAIYGSTTIITTALDNLLSTVNDGMIASVGDLNASGDKDAVEHTFQLSIHLVFLLYGTCTAVLAAFLGPFCRWWVGYSLSDACIYVLLFNFFNGGIVNNVAIYRNSMGLYRNGWKRPAMTVVVNTVTSILLIQKVGIIGALLGTLIANVTTMIWYDPLVVYKYGFKKSIKKFYLRYVFYILSVSFVSAVIILLNKLLPVSETFFSLIWHGILYAVCSAGLLVAIGFALPIQKELFKKCFAIVKAKTLRQ